MRRDVWADLGIDERSFVYLPDILSDGFVGAVDMVIAVLGSWGAAQPGGRARLLLLHGAHRHRDA